MNIKWQNKIPDVIVLKRADAVSVETLLTASQLRWAGHEFRMPDNRLPKQVLYGELLKENWKRGGQKLRYKDVLKHHTRCVKINNDTWEQEASFRPAWRNMLHQATKTR